MSHPVFDGDFDLTIDSAKPRAAHSACPKDSHAGPEGIGEGVVSFGDERVPAQVTIAAFFAPASPSTS
jgi:hypothetical protein